VRALPPPQPPGGRVEEKQASDRYRTSPHDLNSDRILVQTRRVYRREKVEIQRWSIACPGGGGGAESTLVECLFSITPLPGLLFKARDAMVDGGGGVQGDKVRGCRAH